MGARPSSPPQIFGDRRRSARCTPRFLLRPRRMAVPYAAPRSGGQTEEHRRERPAGRSSGHVAETVVRTIVRAVRHRHASAGAMVLLERGSLDHVLGEFQFPFLHHAEHCVLRQQRGAYVRNPAVR